MEKTIKALEEKHKNTNNPTLKAAIEKKMAILKGNKTILK
jgi:hypothetical protein